MLQERSVPLFDSEVASGVIVLLIHSMHAQSGPITAFSSADTTIYQSLQVRRQIGVVQFCPLCDHVMHAGIGAPLFNPVDCDVLIGIHEVKRRDARFIVAAMDTVAEVDVKVILGDV